MSNRISKRSLEAYIINLRSFAMDDCMKAHDASSGTVPNIKFSTSAKVKRQIANELEAILCGED